MDDLNALPLPDLFRALTDDASFVRGLDAALAEDLGAAGDVTTASIIDPARSAEGAVVARRAGRASGLELIPHLARRLDDTMEFRSAARDGDAVEAGQTLGTLRGALSRMLMLERTMLNYLGRLSGVATLTDAFVRLVNDTGTVICDTRKTTPGLRRLEKYAVRCGGGTLHRMGLFDAALYKDNHLVHLSEGTLAEVLTRAIEKARADHQLKFVEVEVDTLDQLDVVLSLPEGLVDIVLLDNMSPQQLRQAVRRRDERRLGLLLEASGGVSLDTVHEIAQTGVDRISVGAITHAAPSLDVSLDIAT